MILLRAFSLLTVALAGFLTGSTRSAPHVYSSGDLHILRLASAGLAHERPAYMLRWLRRHPTIRSAEWIAAAHTLDITFQDGFTSAILSRSIGTIEIPKRSTFHSMARLNSPGGRALVLEPFATQLGLGTTANVEADDLQSAGFQVDQASNGAVTVASMASMSEYNVIYVHTHSGVAPGGEGILATGELSSTNDPAVMPLVNNGDVLVVGVSGSSQLYYAITSGYIQHEVGQFPSNSIFFANGCNLLDAPRFWSALNQKGVGVMVSWNFEATSQDNYLAGAAFFHEMAQGLDVAQAIQAEQAAGLGISVSQGVTAKLGYLGDGTITLQRAASSPIVVAPTATIAPPTVTPTGVPPTPTATKPPIVLNATATPGISPPPPPATAVGHTPLSATVRPLIWPGWWQHITVKSTPNTVIHFLVSYPNGDHQAAHRTTNGHGIATYAYKQGSSKITRQSWRAAVVIEAGSGTTHTTTMVTYRIHPGALDLWAVPRAPKTGGIVHLWVHTHPRTRVMLTLRVAHHQVDRFWTKTGPAGWAHPGRRITGPLATYSGHRVMVVGRVWFGKRSVGTRTFFKVS